MKQKNYLLDAETGAERYEVIGLLATGRHYQVVQVEAAEGRNGAPRLCARAVLYDTERIEDADYILGRRAAMQAEWDFLHKVKSPLLPKPVAFFEACEPGEDSEATAEPVLVSEWRAGLTLFEWIRRVHPEGLDTQGALDLFGEVVAFLDVVHEAGYLFRDLDPRHFIVGPREGDDQSETAERARLVGVVGYGNATPMDTQPNAYKLDYDGSPYVAPEIRGEHDVSALRPSADNYGLGALMSFILTGEEPREVVENPLGHLAYDRLSNLDTPGLSMLVARLIQPNAKNRIGRMEKLAKYATVEGLPNRHVEGFGHLLLPAPFSGVEDPKNNRSLRSKLSPGPLISVESGAASSAKKEAQAETKVELEDEPQTPPAARMPLSWAITAALLGLVSVAALIALGVI